MKTVFFSQNLSVCDLNLLLIKNLKNTELESLKAIMGSDKIEKRNSFMEKQFEGQGKNLRAASKPLAKGNDGGLVRQIRPRHRRSVLILAERYEFREFCKKRKDQSWLGMFELDRSFERNRKKFRKKQAVTLTNKKTPGTFPGKFF